MAQEKALGSYLNILPHLAPFQTSSIPKPNLLQRAFPFHDFLFCQVDTSKLSYTQFTQFQIIQFSFARKKTH